VVALRPPAITSLESLMIATMLSKATYPKLWVHTGEKEVPTYDIVRYGADVCDMVDRIVA